MKTGLCIVCLVLGVSAPLLRAEDTIRTLEDIDAFAADTTPRKIPFEIAGHVLSVFTGPKLSGVVLESGSGIRAELYRFLEDEQPSPGDTIKADGIAFMDKLHEPYLHITEFEVLEKGRPPEPVPVRLSDANPNAHNLLTIRTEGVVIDAVPDEIDSRYTILLLKDGGAIVPVPLPLSIFGDQSGLVDATVRVTGTYRRSISGVRKFSWPNIQPQEPRDIKVLAPPPADPFAFPRLGTRFYQTPEDVMMMSKRTVVGEVLATWAGNQAMVKTDSNLIVNIELANGTTLPRCGETIIAAGLPETDLLRINFRATRWKPFDGLKLPEPETGVMAVTNLFLRYNGRNSIVGESHGWLVHARGVIRTLPPRDNMEIRFVIDDGAHSVPVDVTSNPSVLDGLEIGSEITVTGRCLLLTDVWRQDHFFPQVKGFALVIRSPEDIVVIRKAPWWTPAKFLVVIAALLLSIAGAGSLIMVRRRLDRMKIVERTRLAVELHDSLSQNLAGIACQVAAGDNAIYTDPKSAKTRIKAAERMLQSCRTELRHCLFDLRSDMLEESDFSAAILKALNQFSDETAITVRFNVRRADFPDPAAHAILSIIREFTANAIRHGRAQSVKIAGVTDQDQLKFSVTDNGCGFDTYHRPGVAEGHFGLDGVRDRLKRLNGELVLSSTPGKGTKATVSLPIPKP